MTYFHSWNISKSCDCIGTIKYENTYILLCNYIIIFLYCTLEAHSPLFEVAWWQRCRFGLPPGEVKPIGLGAFDQMIRLTSWFLRDFHVGTWSKSVKNRKVDMGTWRLVFRKGFPVTHGRKQHGCQGKRLGYAPKSIVILFHSIKSALGACNTIAEDAPFSLSGSDLEGIPI